MEDAMFQEAVANMLWMTFRDLSEAAMLPREASSEALATGTLRLFRVRM